MPVNIDEFNAPFLLNYGKDEHKKQILNHTDHHVRLQAARGSKDPAHLDHLVNDPHPDVRRTVAINGEDRHRDKLMHDPDESVRHRVAEMGGVRHHDHLMHDQSVRIRKAVAENGNENHRMHLVKDEDPNVRNTAVSNTHSRDVLLHAANDANESIVKSVIRRAYFKRQPDINHNIAHRVDSDPSYPHYGKHWISQYARDNT